MLKKLALLLWDDPARFAVEIASLFHTFIYKCSGNIVVEGKLRVFGRPLVDIRYGSELILGDNVILNSRNRGYHLNMHSPVKLFADKYGAVIRIGENSRIHGSCLHAGESITIGRNCLIAANCQIFDGSGHDLSFDNVSARIYTVGSTKPVVIEDNVWLGANVIVLPGVTIGFGAVVAANSVVTKNVPQSSLVGGNPAVVISQN
jgi:acetyltransferase-like isoleucine patch superfamily enzyme